jgi:hypothetical protein
VEIALRHGPLTVASEPAHCPSRERIVAGQRREPVREQVVTDPEGVAHRGIVDRLGYTVLR